MNAVFSRMARAFSASMSGLVDPTAVLGMLLTLVCLAAAFVGYVRQQRRTGRRVQHGADHAVPSVGVLHPNAGGGGGGERVLWVALRAIVEGDQRCGIDRRVTLYTKRYPCPTSSSSSSKPVAVERDRADTEHLLQLVQEQFGLAGMAEVASRLEVVYLTRTAALDPSRYPRLTLVLQSVVGGVALFWDVASRGATDVLIDTVGIPFSYGLFAVLAGCTVVTYTHYPTISTDMIRKVASRSADFNNNSAVARSSVLTAVKLAYYRIFATLYRIFAGNFASVVMTNSSWTNNHIRVLWRRQDTSIVYPPCPIERFTPPSSLPPPQRTNSIVSVGQFRPEKNHPLQLEVFAKALQTGAVPANTVLYVVGGARSDEDRQRVANLKRQCAADGPYGGTLVDGENVRFEVSVPMERIVSLLQEATVGLHTMTDEHFGIVVAEYMAAGAIAVAHDSAGPKQDIVQEHGRTGYRCTTADQYVGALKDVFCTVRPDVAKWEAMQRAGRTAAARFTDAAFARRFRTTLAPVLALTLLPEDDDDGVKLCC